nr:MAG TPA: hypothetical protein [Caudoviricetes sp.]
MLHRWKDRVCLGIQPAEPARLNLQNCWKDMVKALLIRGDPIIQIGVSHGRLLQMQKKKWHGQIAEQMQK